MAWSLPFRLRLRRSDEPYAPMFRLQIGTTNLTGRHVGVWEEMQYKVLELLTHPGTSSNAVAGSAGMVRGVNNLPLGQSFCYGVGLTGMIKMGTQSVVPRTWIYTGPTLSVGVTQWGASMAVLMPHGMMSRLQIKMDDHEDSDWETIHVGMYKGMTWSGADYTLNFSCALDIAKSNSTDRHEYSVDDSRYKWFQGCGSTTIISPATITDFTSELSAYSLGTPFIGGERNRLGSTHKKQSAFGGLEHHFGGASAYSPTRTVNNWVKVKNTTPEDTFILYQGLADLGGSNCGLTRATSTDRLELPGYDGLSGDVVTGGIGAGSTVTTVCVLHGTPVTEFVNTVYVEGYHHAMVPGIFAVDWGESVLNRTLNEDDIYAAHNRFKYLFELATGREAIDYNNPFRAVMAAEVGDGVSEMKKRCGKWGVFPRFKAGGYGMAVVEGSGYSPATEIGGSAPVASRVIHVGDIEGAEYRTLPSGAQGGMESLTFESTDADAAGGDFIYHDSIGGYTYYGMPQLGQLKVKTSDVAAGIGHTVRGWGKRFAEYFRSYLYQDYWQKNRVEATLRLRGLKFAAVAPGDYVHVCIPQTPATEGGRTRWATWGPHIVQGISGSSSPGYATHVLDSSNVAMTEAAAAELRADDIPSSLTNMPWMVMSSHVDWVGCKVTLILQTSENAMAAREFVPTLDSILTDQLGIVEPKKRHE